MPRLPSLTPKEVVRALEHAGLHIVREGANHAVLWREGLARTVTVPRHKREMSRGLLAGIIREAGLSQEEFRKHIR